MENKMVDETTVEEAEVKTEETTQVETEVETEEIEESAPKKEQKVIDGSFFNKIGDKIKAKIDKTKHNFRVATQINHLFAENASRYTLVDTAVKGFFKILLEKDEEAKTLTFLGKLKLKEKALLKDKEGNMLKIVELVEGEHTRTFEVEGEQHVRTLTVYSYTDI